MRHNRRDDGQLSCRKREMKTMKANTALDGHTTVIKMAERGGVPLSAQIDQGDRTEAIPSLAFQTAMVVKVKDAETKRNKVSVEHTGWNKRKKTSTTTPKKVCLYSSSLLFQQKICKSESDRAAGKPDTPCDWASFVKERGLMRSSPTVLQSSLSFLSCFFFPVFSVVSSIL